MKTSFKTLGAVTTAFLMATTAAHADAAMWEGGYAGIGIANATVEIELEGLGTADADGTGFGLYAGYNVAMSDQFVVGGELAYGDVTVDDGGDDLDTSEMSIRLRAGYAVESVLIYGAIGLSKLELSVPGDSVDDTGFLFALGAEYMVAPSFSIRGEYSMSKYDDFDDTPGVNIDNDVLSLSAAFHF